MPASCEQCNPVELLPGNRESWDLANRFPDMIRPDPHARRYIVDYPAARAVAEAAHIPDPLRFFDDLTAIARGLNKNG